jgi:pimeloyl-ACP methyl ester carboxylesterase
VSDEIELRLTSGRLVATDRGAKEAPLLICVPGLSVNHQTFDLLSRALAGPERRVVALTLRGRGRSDRTAPGTYGWKAHASDVLEAATQLGAETFDLAGHSMGAFVSQQVAGLAPDRVRSLVLIDGLGAPEPTSLGPIGNSANRLGKVFRDRDAVIAEVRGSGVIEPWSDEFERIYRDDLEDVEGGVQLRASREAVGEDAVYGASQQPDGLWPGISMRTLVVRATRPMLPGLGLIVSAADRDRFLSEHPNAELLEVDASHYTIVMDPKVIDGVRSFVRRSAS